MIFVRLFVKKIIFYGFSCIFEFLINKSNEEKKRSVENIIALFVFLRQIDWAKFEASQMLIVSVGNEIPGPRRRLMKSKMRDQILAE